MKIAVIEDEERLAKALKRGFEGEGGDVDLFFTAESAQATLEYSGNLYDLVILDLMLPDGDGAALCSSMRATGVNAPILVLTARDSTADKVDLLDRGADDFLTKPFEFEELLARGRALARRTASQEVELTVDDMTIVPDRRSVVREGKDITLTAKEFELLMYLVRNRGRVIGRDELAAKVWKHKEMPPTNVVDVHVRNLRKKIDDPYATKSIHTIHGVGYTIAR